MYPRSDSSTQIAKILFSRCLEEGHWPDKIQFTKYLYLLDYCYWRFHGQQLTDIHWKFYHYGPWSNDASLVMNSVQDHFRLGWRDFTEDDDKEFQGFDRIYEKLHLGVEGLIKSLLKAFKNRDVTDLIDFCYTQTEPMIQAKRGDDLDFSSVPVNQEMPLFKVQAATREMPQINEASQSRIEAYSSKVEQLKMKALKWRKAMRSPSYESAMQMLEQEQTSKLPDLHNRKIKLDDNSVNALQELKDE